jgi:putative sterol carrier protein
MAAAARHRGNGAGAGLSGLARQTAEAALAAFVRGRSDSQLERTIGSSVGLRLLFKGMEQAYVPEKAGGFEGEILYELSTSNGPKRWTVAVNNQRAVAEERDAHEPAVTMRLPLPLFIRLAANEASPAVAMLEGDLVVEGDFVVAGRLNEMFGGEPQW